MRTVVNQLRQAAAALRMLLVLTVVCGVCYPLVVTAIAQLPGLNNRADGSPVSYGGHEVGSSLIGQSFIDKHGDPLPQYFQSRPSAGSYDPTATGASNLGPESIVDAPHSPSLLSQVCTRSVEIGKRYGVDGSRPFCTADGVGAVLAVLHAGPGYHGVVTRAVSLNQACPATTFLATYRGVAVQCAAAGVDYSAAQVVPIRGPAATHPPVPSDAVTASGSGLDAEISPDYARLQEALVARTRGITTAQVAAVVNRHELGRDLGFLGEPRVNVLRVNLDLDSEYPYRK